MTIQQLRSALAAKRNEIDDLLTNTKATATRENRAWTAQEHAAIQALVAEGKAIGAKLERAQSDDAMSDQINRMSGTSIVGASGPRGGSLGSQFIQSPTFQWLREHHGQLPAGQWASPSSELLMQATTLDTSSGSGGPLVIPDYRDGILPLPQRPLTISDLVSQGTTDGNVISYMKEKTFTNAAAPVAEAGTKPESTLVFEAATSAVRKIAHWIPITEEMLEDASSSKGFIDARMLLGVQLVEDDQLLNGNGTPPALLGFMNLPGLTTAQARGADITADAILKQIMTVWLAVGAMPDGIVMNPSNWQTVLLAKDSAGNYIGGSGPFSSPRSPSLWGIPIAVTSAITANTALVGVFRSCAQIFRKGGLRIEASNSHANFFVENKVALRAEERLALAVYRESAFGKVTGLN